MSTSFARQLSSLGEPRRRGRGRPSLLYSATEAASLDLAAVRGVALAGLSSLAPRCPALASFLEDIFSEAWASPVADRESRDAAGAALLDARLAAAVRALSPFLGGTAAAQALEYLVRRWDVHVHNVDALLEAALPWSETPLFGRLVQILSLGGAPAGAGGPAAPPPRALGSDARAAASASSAEAPATARSPHSAAPASIDSVANKAPPPSSSPPTSAPSSLQEHAPSAPSSLSEHAPSAGSSPSGRASQPS